MKILVIGHSLVVDTNRALFAQIAMLGHEVDVVTPKKWKSNLIAQLEYLNNPTIDNHFTSVFPVDCYYQGNGSFYTYNVFQLYKILNQKKYDAIIVLQETWSLSLTQVNLLRYFSNSMHSKLYIFPNQNIKKKHFLFLLPLEFFNTMDVSRILYPTEGVREVIEWKGIRTKCSLFSYTYDSSLFVKKKKNESEFLKIGYLGRITEEKGIFILLDAFRSLKKVVPNIKLKIAGNGPLVHLIKNEADIEYVGIIPHAKAHEFYQDVDIFVLPSQTMNFWKEQFGRVLIEAAASGNLVIGSSSGAIPEVLEKIGMPYCFKEDSSQDLLEKLKETISDLSSDRFDLISNSSIAKCIEQFSHKSVAQVFDKYLKEDFLK